MTIARSAALAIVFAAGVASTGCTSSNPTEVITNGFVADDQTLALAPVGSSREQVTLSLGSPSATATFGNEVYYYISQKRERRVAFMKPTLISQSVLAVYFDNKGNVEHLANYTIKDGKVFDMVSNTTPTGGNELTFLQRMLSGGSSGANAMKSMLGAKQSNGGYY